MALIRHPTYAEGLARAWGRPLAEITAAQLANWNEHLADLAAHVESEGPVNFNALRPSPASAGRRGRDAFTEAYLRGVTEELGPPPRRPRALPPAPFALRGAVITPEGAWPTGYVTVADGVIDRVSRRRPTSVPVHETDGVILPGLLDLHGHPEFNVFAAWEPPTLYANRYRWRSSAPYQALVRNPQNSLIDAVPAKTQLRYSEVRALVGGVTGIQGASGASTSTMEPLVRNVDLWAFGAHRARSLIDLPSGSFGKESFDAIMRHIAAGTVTAFYVHLSEGVRGDERSVKEFTKFLDLEAATPATNIIHGSALSADDLRTVAELGCRLVWSPQSNLRLYGETTLAGEAIKAGMPVALGADWLPSGSTSLLAEMKVARRELARQGHAISAADLVAMVTSVAATMTGLDAHLGAIAVGRPADLVVLERHHEDPYENVCLADPSWVELVCIGGDVTYARADWFAALSGDAAGTTIEDLIAWGKPMRLDTGFQSPAAAPTPSLRQIRSLLTAAYPSVGPSSPDARPGHTRTRPEHPACPRLTLGPDRGAMNASRRGRPGSSRRIVGTLGALAIGVGTLTLGACAKPDPTTTGVAAVGAAAAGGSADAGALELVNAAAQGAPQAGGDKAGMRQRLLRALHATWVTDGKDGVVTHHAIRGEVTAVSPTSITVEAKDGVSMTFAVGADTKVRQRTLGQGRTKGTDSTIGAVKVGIQTLVVGTGASGPTAQHVIFLAGAGTPGGSSTQSPSATS